MADGLPQFKEEQPIFHPQQIADKSGGFDAMAQVFGQVANAAGAKVKEIEEDQSQAMYIHSVSNIEQLKTSAQMNMLEHPDQASKIAENMQTATDMVKQASFVNSKDRARLDAYVSGANDDVSLQATKTNVHQTQLMAAYTHYASWPDQLTAYRDALMKDDGSADKLKDAMMGTLKNLVSIGAITPEQAGSGIKSMSGVVDIVRDNVAMYNNGNASAADYHAVNSTLFNKTPSANVNTPVDEAGAWSVNYYSQDKSFQGVLSDLYNHNLPNPQVFDSLPPAQRQHAILTMNGVRQADGLINSGTPFPVIESAYKSLTQKGRVLNYREEGMKNSLATYIGRINSGDFLGAIEGTPGGGAILHSYINKNSAIDSSPMSDQDKSNAKVNNLNDVISRAASYGQGLGYPSSKIQPIPQSIVSNTEQGFQLGNDPSLVLANLGQLTKQNQTYLANSMKNPDQRLVVQAMAFSPNTIKPQDKLDFIAANQQGRSFIGKEAQTQKDKDLVNRIYGNLGDQLRMIGQNYDFESAQTLQKSMLDTTLKYAKYLAAKDNNMTMENQNWVGIADWKKYVDKASEIYKTSFNQVSGTNYTVNPNQLPVPLGEKDLDMLAAYAINKGQEYLKAGRHSYEYESALSRNQLKMIFSPTNDLQAVDGNGKVYFSEPFTTSLVEHARADAAKREVERRKLLGEAIERQQRQLLNVRLPEDANAPK